MVAVAERKKKGRRGRKAGPPTEQVGIRVPEDMLAALDEQVRSSRRTRTVEVLIALEEYLTRLGRWPRKPHADGSPPAK